MLLTMNKGSGVFRTSSPSQESQDEYAVRDFVTSDGVGGWGWGERMR